jgi:transcriptional regulator GlxA family with amidase domain
MHLVPEKSFLTPLSLVMQLGFLQMSAGFSSPSYFVKMFREREGITPLEYRRRNRSVEL